jgi:hypothetical protein
MEFRRIAAEAAWDLSRKRIAEWGAAMLLGGVFLARESEGVEEKVKGSTDERR